MGRGLKILLVLLLVALVPARAIGSVTISICASQQEQGAAVEQSHVQHGDHGSHDNQGDHAQGMDPAEASHGDVAHACGYCAAHCAGVAFAVPTDLIRAVSPASADRIPFGTGSEPSSRAARLDRPPLLS